MSPVLVVLLIALILDLQLRKKSSHVLVTMLVLTLVFGYVLALGIFNFVVNKDILTGIVGIAAAALNITAADLSRLGLVDGVVADLGLTHTELAHDLVREVELALDELSPLSADELVARRYDKFRAMGGDRTCSL